MKEFINGVGYYTKATAEICFPEDDICCHWCPLMGSEINPKREYCRKTGEYLFAPRHTIGENCPLNFNNKENNDGEYETI